MGDYFVRDKTGGLVVYEIAGDEPDDYEKAHIAADLNGTTTTAGTTPSPDPEPAGWFEQAGRGVAAGFNQAQAGMNMNAAYLADAIGNSAYADKQRKLAEDQMREAGTYASKIEGDFTEQDNLSDAAKVLL